MKFTFLILFFLCARFSLNAQIVDIPDVNFKNALLNSNCVDTDGNTLPDADADINNDGEIQVSEAEAVIHLAVTHKNISSLAGIENFSNLESLKCNNNNLTTLSPVTSLTSLRSIYAQYNQISSFDASPLINLEYLQIRLNGLTSLNVDNLLSLAELFCGQNQLTNLDVSTALNLEYLHCGDNQISELNLYGLNNLEQVIANDNLLTSFDGSDTSISALILHDNNLSEIFLKNGVGQNSVGFNGNPNLSYICVDEFEGNFIYNVALGYGYNLVVNSYCSFSPGGETYIVQGRARQSLDDNICDIDDPAATAHIKYLVDNGTDSGYFFSSITGDYVIEVGQGDHIITPQLEYQNYYDIIPNNTVVSFPEEVSPFNQDFCFLPNEAKNDLEIVFIPITGATPGFISRYRVVYRNTGNTTLSDFINLEYDQDSMNLSSSTENPLYQSEGMITWSFVNLQPFETRSFVVEFLINTPTETNSVQVGDILCFNVEIEPISIDETPENNIFDYCQIVTNSMDPNDITCLEGETISQEKVGEYVHYLIRFENLGTANAVNVVVKDVIDETKFYVSSLIPLHASHNYVTRIREGNIVEFIFENIQLPFDDANNDGYVVFKIKTLDTLILGDTFENEAEIYFDFNFPVITNNYVTTVAEDNLSIDDLETPQFNVYPNPVKDYITISTSINLDEVYIRDINGRVIKRFNSIMQDSENSFDVSSLTSGLYFIELKSDTSRKALKFIKE